MKLFLKLILTTSFLFKLASAEPIGTTNNADANAFSNKAYTKLKTPIHDLITTTEWTRFMKEFEVTMETTFCSDNLLALVGSTQNTGGLMPVGLNSHMIEPLGYIESTRKPFYFPSFDISIKSNAKFDGTSYVYDESLESSSFRSVSTDAHFIKAPLMGIIFKKKIKFLCFTKPEITFPFLSEFYPGWKKDKFESKLMLAYTNMMTPQGMLTGILEIIAIEVANAKRGNTNTEEIDLDTIAASPSDIHDQNAQTANGDIYENDDWESGDGHQESQVGNQAQEEEFESQTMKYIESVFNTIIFMYGTNFVTIGGYTDGVDPVSEGQELAWTMVNKMAVAGTVGGIFKQTNRDTNGGLNAGNNVVSYDTMCRPRYYPIGIQSQYCYQQTYPVTGSCKEGGVMGIHHTGKYRPSAEGVSYLIWSRRDYAAMAYKCP
jgi:hypothetical protein